MKFPSIKEVAGMNDAQLSEFLDFPGKLTSFKGEIDELNELTGDAREEADRMWAERMAPSISSDSLRWMKEDAIRSVKKEGKELMDSTEPSDVF